MTRQELKELLQAHEWRDVEFKEAQRAVPNNAYETVSAFANTEGGHLVFGVKKDGEDVEVVGVLDVDKVQGDFLTTLRQRDKISTVVEVQEEAHRQGDADLLLFYIPEAHRQDKPVYLNGDIRRAFIRSGASDIRCSENERNRFLMDAASERFDGQAVDFAPETAFDEESLRWYRAVYEGRPGNRSYADLPNADFLDEMGLLVERGGERRPTRAAILLFGTNRTFRQLLPRLVVDCQRFSSPRAEADVGERWFDRMELDENLVRVWRALVDDWYPRIAERPFRVDPSTMRRDDAPPDYRAFREAMVNLLLHQDYADHTRKAVIQSYPDQTVFWNPGDAFATGTDLLEPGEKEVRNPRLVLAFRRLGISENAGWGMRDMYRNWRELGHVPPIVTNDKGRKAFEVVLSKEALLSAEQVAFQRGLGIRLTDDQAAAFAYLRGARTATATELRAITGCSATQIESVLGGLRSQILVQGPDPAGTYSLAPHLVPPRVRVAGRGSAEVTASGGRLIVGPTKQELRILLASDVPRTATELAKLTGLPRSNFRERYLEPLVSRGMLRIVNTDKPAARNRRYVLAEDGVAAKAAWIAHGGDERGAG